jgi:hypothetical protein
MTRVTVAPMPRLLTSDHVRSEVERARESGGVVSDACALTIASQWQDPSPRGRVFAELASTGSADADALGVAIDREIADAVPDSDLSELYALELWVERKVRGLLTSEHVEAPGWDVPLTNDDAARFADLGLLVESGDAGLMRVGLNGLAVAAVVEVRGEEGTDKVFIKPRAILVDDNLMALLEAPGAHEDVWVE